MEHKFKKGDLVKSNLCATVFDEEEWYGIVLDIYPDAPHKHPILADKYKIQWCGGKSSWIFGHSIDLVANGRRQL